MSDTIPLAALIAVLALPAGAGGHDEAPTQPFPEVFYSEPGPHDPDHALGVILHNNQLTLGNPEFDVRTIETPFGPAVVELRTTPNTSCEPRPCPDTLYIIAPPEGMIAIPHEITTPERGWSRIILTHHYGF